MNIQSSLIRVLPVLLALAAMVPVAQAQGVDSDASSQSAASRPTQAPGSANDAPRASREGSDDNSMTRLKERQAQREEKARRRGEDGPQRSTPDAGRER
ncbi:hypothetical protein [Salinicola rhizosphaerae]|uniref:Uncharacterized protein n=1 Tax=Salinicola rhizosphaerae TaxID=1443141 RepID=A0ABQ3EEY1_9GAMM|nr:hypothetical protein [Salinicola rhizosphaerae]GHB34211.1 hypothetical protein GCM10009038_36610 [Salinicola rhizosphaerae]